MGLSSTLNLKEGAVLLKIEQGAEDLHFSSLRPPGWDGETFMSVAALVVAHLARNAGMDPFDFYEGVLPYVEIIVETGILKRHN